METPLVTYTGLPSTSEAHRRNLRLKAWMLSGRLGSGAAAAEPPTLDSFLQSFERKEARLRTKGHKKDDWGPRVGPSEHARPAPRGAAGPPAAAGGRRRLSREVEVEMELRLERLGMAWAMASAELLVRSHGAPIARGRLTGPHLSGPGPGAGPQDPRR
ncbi:unnamed protein product [Merluccius merluccius]